MENKKKLNMRNATPELLDELNAKSKAVDAKINEDYKKLSDQFEMRDKYGELFSKLFLTTAIDFCMNLTSKGQDKINRAEIINSLNIVGKFLLYKEGVMIIDKNGIAIPVEPLHKIVNDFETEKKLKTSERHNDCHAGSWGLMSTIGDKENKKIVTSLVKGGADDAEYIHTWIEYTENGEEKVADYTLNAIMNKDFYYALRTVDETQITKISEDDFNKERPIIESLVKNGAIERRQYLAFRDEIMINLKQKGLIRNPEESE